MKEDKTWFLDDGTTASHPGGVRVSIWRWALHHPLWPIGLFAYMLFGVTLMWLHSLLWAIALPILIVMQILYWRRIKEHMFHGNICPGIVISKSPLRVAVYTDLSKGFGSFPVIKIMEHTPYRRWSGRPEIGTRVVTVALYEQHADSENLPHWNDFQPVLAAPIIKTRKDLEKLEASMLPEYWDTLEDALKHVTSRKPGLHPVHFQESGWDDQSDLP